MIIKVLLKQLNNFLKLVKLINWHWNNLVLMLITKQ